MKQIKPYTQLIEEGVSTLSFPEEPHNLYEPLRYFMQLGGKRIRPVLTLMGAELFGVKREQALPQALAIEVFHNFTLIHDDIMDEAPIRRGQPTVHNRWNSNIAILSGDALLIKAYQLISEMSSDRLPDAIDLFNTTALEVCEGQQMDLDFEERMDVSTAEYIEMIRLKTSVLLGCALELGAIVAGASKEDRKHLYSFGQHIGIAFQIQDDILDVYGDPEKFGKQPGGDIIANKKTMLYLTAQAVASESQRETLKQLRSESDLVSKVERTRLMFEILDVRSQCEAVMQRHLDLALQSLESISSDSDSKVPLKTLAHHLLDREH